MTEELPVSSVKISGGSGSSGTDKKKAIKAKMAVISNLSVWDLFRSGIVKDNAFPVDVVKDRKATPAGKSLMHLQKGFEMSKEGLLLVAAPS